MYTRYADDITFSTFRSALPDEVAHQIDGSWQVSPTILELIKAEGFEINEAKTRFQTRSVHQEVTGVVVNEFPNVHRSYLRGIRSILHDIETNGVPSAEARFQHKFGPSDRGAPRSLQRSLLGRIEFVGLIRGRHDPTYVRYLKRYGQIWPLKSGKVPDRWTLLQNSWETVRSCSESSEKGPLLEMFIAELFRVPAITVITPFRRIRGAEQIDGALSIGPTSYLIECKNWTARLSAHHDSPLRAKVEDSGAGTFGICVSVAGWTPEFEAHMEQATSRKILCFTGDDIQQMITQEIDPKEALTRKLNKLQVHNKPCCSLSDAMKM